MPFHRVAPSAASGASAYPRGAWPSAHNSRVLVSAGLHELDACLGGGLPLGSVLLLEEDAATAHALTLLRLFAAEGVACGHALALASADAPAAELLASLPLERSSVPQTEVPRPPRPAAAAAAAPALKVAWRYGALVSGGGGGAPGRAPGKRHCHSFDLSQRMTAAGAAPPSGRQQLLHDVLPGAAAYAGAIAALRAFAAADGDVKHVGAARRVVRIGVHALGSPLWGAPDESQAVAFVHALRGLCASAGCVAIVTAPAHLQSPRCRARLRCLADAVISLDAFEGRAPSEGLGDHTGLLHVRKLPRHGALAAQVSGNSVFGFMATARRWAISPLHPPPAGTEAGGGAKKAPAAADLEF